MVPFRTIGRAWLKHQVGEMAEVSCSGEVSPCVSPKFVSLLEDNVSIQISVVRKNSRHSARSLHFCSLTPGNNSGKETETPRRTLK